MRMIPLEDLMPRRVPSLNPAKHPNENFELWSIPAFDRGKPEVTEGLNIGSSKKCIEPNDVLLSRIVPHIRRSWVVVQSKNGLRQIASGEWIVFRNSEFHPQYLRHALTSDSFHARFMQTVAGVGGSLLRARPEGVKRIKIPLPPLEEQKRIAAILDKADAIRRSRKKAISLTEELLRSTFLDMFGDPVTNPKGWNIVPIELLATKSKNALAIGPFGSNLKVDDYREEGHPVIFVRDVREDSFTQVSKVFVDDCKFEELKSHHVRPDDVIATKMGLPPCKAAVYPNSMPTGVITADIIKVSLDKEIVLPKYVSTAINSEYCKRQVAKFTEGITRPKVTLRDFKKLRIPCPPITLQEEWEAFCDNQKQIVERLEKSLNLTSDVFNSLLQKAFRGEL